MNRTIQHCLTIAALLALCACTTVNIHTDASTISGSPNAQGEKTTDTLCNHTQASINGTSLSEIDASSKADEHGAQSTVGQTHPVTDHAVSVGDRLGGIAFGGSTGAVLSGGNPAAIIGGGAAGGIAPDVFNALKPAAQ